MIKKFFFLISVIIFITVTDDKYRKYIFLSLLFLCCFVCSHHPILIFKYLTCHGISLFLRCTFCLMFIFSWYWSYLTFFALISWTHSSDSLIYGNAFIRLWLFWYYSHVLLSFTLFVIMLMLLSLMSFKAMQRQYCRIRIFEICVWIKKNMNLRTSCWQSNVFATELLFHVYDLQIA